ncbi:MAG TPA: hypothetical protein DCL42_04375 [Deltaproteobacteria bacterium]|nr:hypothetical protein [Deltaproteobacteria bacterium]
MKKLILGLAILFTLSANASATTQWRDGDGSNTVLGSISPSTIDTAIYTNIVSPLDNLLAVQRQGLRLTYASAATITVESGASVNSNSTGTIRLFGRNSSSTTLSWADIDTGAEANSTTYHVYSFHSATSDTTLGFKISASASAPTGATYYQKLGSFYNDASGNITNITNNDFKPRYYDSGWFAVAASTAYTKTHNLGTQKILPIVFFSPNSDGSGEVTVNTVTDTAIGGSGSSAAAGAHVGAITATSFSVRCAAHVAFFLNDNGTKNGGDQDVTTYTSGYARVVAMALE